MKARRGRNARPLFPRKLPPMPRIAADPRAALVAVIAERRARERRRYAVEEARRLREVKAAFAEAFETGRKWGDPREDWLASIANRALWPPVLSPRDAMDRMVHERRCREDEGYAERASRRIQEVIDAFEQGHWAGAVMIADVAEAWQLSPIRRSLYLGPPAPLNLRIRMMASGGYFDARRQPGGPNGEAAPW